MKRFVGTVLAIGVAACVLAAQKPLATAPKFDGKFVWLKCGTLPAATTKSFAHAKSLVVKIALKKDAHLKPDKNGNLWFTVILADQGSDWKWHQTTGSGIFLVSGRVVKAATYEIAIPVAGIPANVLSDKMQTVSVGPASSGLASPVPMVVLGVRGG